MERRWLLDAGVAAWVAGWIVIGVLVGTDLHHLDRLATTLGTSGEALAQTAQALHGFTHLPLVGKGLSKLVASIAITAHQVQANAALAGSSVDQLAYLLAVAIAAIPSVSVLSAYLPRRLGTRTRS